MFYDDGFLKSPEIRLKLRYTVDADPESGELPAYFFDIFLSGTNEEIGSCHLRTGQNAEAMWGGHIGYVIDAPYRGRHFAAKACMLLFELAAKHGMDTVYITCNPENIASRKTCEYAGCVLDGIFDAPKDSKLYQSGERRFCRYRFMIRKGEEYD